jgi:hypothetical protein
MKSTDKCALSRCVERTGGIRTFGDDLVTVAQAVPLRLRMGDAPGIPVRHIEKKEGLEHCRCFSSTSTLQPAGASTAGRDHAPNPGGWWNAHQCQRHFPRAPIAIE